MQKRDSTHACHAIAVEKITLVHNKNYKDGISSSIKAGLNKISKKDKGFIILQSDMPFVKTTDINKIYNSIIRKKYLVHALNYDGVQFHLE